MKNKKSFPNFFFRLELSGLVIILLLLLNAITVAQEQTPPKEFVLDASVSYDGLFVEPIYNSFIDCGFNTMTQRATIDSKPLLENFNLHAINMKDSIDWIYYYSSSYYSKWEAEVDKQSKYEVGVKHSAGETAYWNDGNDTVLCWSTKGVTAPVDTLVYGPTYHQVKFYKRWLYDNYNIFDRLKYTPRFRMALTKHPSVPDTQAVCRLYVIMKYRKIVNNIPDGDDSLCVLKEPITLRVSDFPSNGEFDYFYLSNIPSQRPYKYPSWLWDPITDKLIMPDVENIYRDDKWAGTGVQFCIDWLRSDTLCTLYIDNIEVYDNDGWNYFIADPEGKANDIKNYALYYKNTGWSNIKNWMGGHEPQSLDSYTPIRIVDSLLQSPPLNAPPLMNTVWAYWTLELNGEPHLERYYNTVQPNKLLVEFHPIQAGYDVPPPFAFEVLRRIFQISYTLTQEKKFYYHVQSYGQWKDNNWYYYRRPTVPEYKTTIMLALSHGADGLVQASYDSQPPGPIYHGIYGLIGIAPDYDTTDLWYELRDNLIPRIKGNLGKTLMTLNYTGDYLYLGRYLQNLCCGFENSLPTVTERYLTMTEYTPDSYDPPVHFHAGFFSRPSYPLDNYFMLDNLITTDERKVWVTVEPPVSGYTNYRFRNVEGVFDTTFDGNSNGIVKLLTYPSGEGYLYQVAPVVLFGGRLRYPELVGEEQVLTDDMIIENGATLTVYNNYFADGNIIVKNGSIVNGENGKIQFANGKKLIIEGAATIAGTASHKLIIDFVSPENGNGIVIKRGASLNISYCEIKNAVNGINSELNANYINAQYVDFIDCDSVSINILGRSPGQAPTPPPQINSCTMLNSNYGIFITNLPVMLIQNNIITNTACGIYLSNVTDAQIIGNVIQSNREEYPGVWFFSSGGAIRANLITGHTSGIHLANSAPVLGSNRMTSNKYHGLYIGDGSRPYMRQGQWIGRPPNMYATSGYNKIYDNGGYEEEGGPDDNDGSEIYFVNSNAVMSKGCNSIYDNREPEPPLVNTYLLMNCPAGGNQIYIDARGNYWGNRVEPGRFGFLRVDYIPYLETPCPEPQNSNDEFVRMTSFGDVIDTVYSIDEEIPEMDEIEEAYAEAEEYFLTGDLTNALQIYESILNSNSNEEDKYFAYERKYSIGKLTGQSTEYFNELSITFSTLALNTQDTLNKKILNQFTTLSKVGEQEYETAITEFDNIVQQNPNTEEAVYAEIDALTTALLIEEADSTLQKGRLGKYLIKSSADYNQRIDEILRKHFGSESKDNQKELIPTEFTLYQNFPNPFNPTTTIKYDLPNASEVSLIIYDILGRQVKALVNAKQQPGRYEVQFNASALASGVYIYQLIADKFISSKKMILLK